MSCNGLRQRPFEVYPERATDDIPDRDDQVVFGENVAPPRTWPIATGAGAGQWISAREGWRAKTFGRSKQAHKPFFHVIEFWLETADDRRCAACDVQGSQDFLKGTQALMMSDPTSLRLMRATQITLSLGEPCALRIKGGRARWRDRDRIGGFDPRLIPQPKNLITACISGRTGMMPYQTGTCAQPVQSLQ